MQALEELIHVTTTLQNGYVRDWKKTGAKVVGYVCSYLPEEILHAADVLPYRITGRGCSDTARADAYLTKVNCTFARCCLEHSLSGRYGFLDGAVFVNGCDHIRRAFDNWKAQGAALPFMYILPVPHVLSPEARNWYRKEVSAFKEAVETYFGIPITPEKLSEAISTYNQTRSLLRRLYELRRADPPPLNGIQAQSILSAANGMPKAAFNRILSELLEKVETRKPAGDRKTRLMVAGSVLDDVGFIENIEDMGAVVVTDALCVGARSCWDLTDESRDPFEALVDRYFHHVPCPRMFGEYEKRLSFVVEQVEHSQVEGVILEQIKFCDLHGADNALLKRDLEKKNIPAMEIERQYGPLADAGRIRTRVQAFLERIRR